MCETGAVDRARTCRWRKVGVRERRRRRGGLVGEGVDVDGVVV